MLQVQNNSVVHVSSAHPYTDNRVHYRECKALADAGFDVSLVATDSTVDGPSVNVKVLTIPRRSRIQRVVVSTVEAVWKALRTRSKFVHLHDPELIPFIPLLRMAGRIVIYDAHEDLPAQILNKDYLNKAMATAFAGFARLLVRVANMSNLIVCATETVALRFVDSKTVVVRNYPPLRAEENRLEHDARLRSAAVVYVGGISNDRGAGTMIDVLDESRMPKGWRLKLAGTVSPSLLDDLTKRAGWSHVDFVGQVAPEAARDLILGSRVGLVLLKDTPAYRDSLPTKMFEYFASGVPVVASDFPLWRSIVETYECGILVSPESSSEIADAVRKYADDPDLWARHSRNARRLAVNQLNWSSQASILVRSYRELREK